MDKYAEQHQNEKLTDAPKARSLSAESITEGFSRMESIMREVKELSLAASRALKVLSTQFNLDMPMPVSTQPRQMKASAAAE